MTCLAHRVVRLLPSRWQASIERESRDWVMKCGCGHETSIWDMGGVRFAAKGRPQRPGRCEACGAKFVGPVYRRSDHAVEANLADAHYDSSTILPLNEDRPIGSSEAAASPGPAEDLDALLWIDSVGCYRILGGDRVSIGGPATGADGADIRLAAPLSRRQAWIRRENEGYWLDGGEADRSGGLPLRPGVPFEVGGGVRLRLRVPTPLSNTATLEFVSRHRPSSRCDAIILMEQVCLLGPTEDAHIRCPDWSAGVVLFRRQGTLWCKGRGGLAVNGLSVARDVPLTDGSVLAGEDLRLRVEMSCGERSAEDRIDFVGTMET
ncbi:MAG: hypothetical protein KF774_18195 [Planctomyces sp.]|nr:hypothetical protein [Planctomyces sp.]